MKSFLLCLSFCWGFTATSLAQNYEIEYNHTVTFKLNTLESVYKLAHSPRSSIYYQVEYEFFNGDGNESLPMDDQSTPFVKKEYHSKRVIHTETVMNEKVFVEDELPLQTWELKAETKKIKSFNCKKAVTTFRGRNYTAWYTEDLSIIGGPWKFDGLPGLILEVASDDGVLIIEATQIEQKEEVIFPDFAYKEKDLITWEEFCKRYQKAIKRIWRNMMADTDTDVEYGLEVNSIEDLGLEQTKWK
ncbi:MAG TPA: GLPGLI family protein [Saprospiraceae bacterium]|nr:GLPGLI family protein [Saprospiraceae bacterium]